MIGITVFFLTASHVAAAEVAGPRYSYFKDENPYFLFSHRTPYNITANTFAIPIKFPTCTPVYIWSYIRHGTRYPDKDLILKIKELPSVRDDAVKFHESDKGGLHPLDLTKLQKWQYNPLLEHYDVAGELTMDGVREIRELSKWFKLSLDKLLNYKKSENFVFQTSDANRSIESGIHFVNILLDTTGYNRYENNEIRKNKKLLRLTDNCPKYRAEEEKPSVLQELNLFKVSAEMNKTLRDVSRRLGYDTILPYDVVEAIYVCCAYESGTNRKFKSPFCSALRKEDFKVFEYREDLEMYWKKGYGNQFTEKVACPLVRDMMRSLQFMVERNSTSRNAIRGSFYFGHLEMIMAMFVKFGLCFEEEPLRHDNYEKMKEDRKWRLSYNGTFASNLNAILLSCTSKKLSERYHVVFYFNGREIVLPKCGKSPCPWSELKSHFETVFDESQCNADFCNE
ncbi:multiple inositol polyphosphate phosphatase 1-like [Planococcus citri]|uniref:multiple inositol polyphosphate phosphatase 1-like n=1 Tax=Planococcus citri TaxID=170843 RepID=UPI0031F8C413